MLLSGSGHLFQSTLQLKYTKVLSSHALIIAALYGMALPNSLVRNFKNYKIVLSDSSLNLAMILVPDFFLTRLVGVFMIISSQLISVCNLFVPVTSSYNFRNAKKKLFRPKPRTDYLKRGFSYSGAIVWNNLTKEKRTSNSLAFFKRSSHRWFLISTPTLRIFDSF